MILYSEQNVYEAAKERIRQLFSIGGRLGVCFSGGKDSTALLHITLKWHVNLVFKDTGYVS